MVSRVLPGAKKPCGGNRRMGPPETRLLDSRFDCRDLLQRSVIYYEAERKASSAIISAPVQGVMTGTVASVSRGPSEDRCSGLVSIQAGAFILAAQFAAFIVAAGVNPSYSFLIQRAACKATSVGGSSVPSTNLPEK